MIFLNIAFATTDGTTTHPAMGGLSLSDTGAPTTTPEDPAAKRATAATSTNILRRLRSAQSGAGVHAPLSGGASDGISSVDDKATTASLIETDTTHGLVAPSSTGSNPASDCDRNDSTSVGLTSTIDSGVNLKVPTPNTYLFDTSTPSDTHLASSIKGPKGQEKPSDSTG